MGDPEDVCEHDWRPFGPPPRYHDYLPHVVQCDLCGQYAFADGQEMPADLVDKIRPYRNRPDGEGRGWTFYRPDR